jgi:hypothetical protein
MPITLRANTIGSLAAETLRTSRDSGIIGQVVNTFSNSFYVKATNGELVFVTNRSLRSPVTINLDPTPSLDQIIKILDSVHCHDEEIHLSEVSIDLHHVQRWHSKSGFPSHLDSAFNNMEESLRITSFILGIVDTTQSVLDLHGLTHEGLTRFVSEGVLPLRHEGMEFRFLEIAPTIVGLGSGFTPSGDDTLGGFLAAYNALAKAVERPRIILDFSTLQQRTSWISAKLLDYMQRLILDEQLCLMIEAAAKGDADSLILEVQALLPRGHTSGIDIAVGTILALSIIRDIILNEEDTERIISKLRLMP